MLLFQLASTVEVGMGSLCCSNVFNGGGCLPLSIVLEWRDAVSLYFTMLFLTVEVGHDSSLLFNGFRWWSMASLCFRCADDDGGVRVMMMKLVMMMMVMIMVNMMSSPSAIAFGHGEYNIRSCMVYFSKHLRLFCFRSW